MVPSRSRHVSTNTGFTAGQQMARQVTLVDFEKRFLSVDLRAAYYRAERVLRLVMRTPLDHFMT